MKHTRPLIAFIAFIELIKRIVFIVRIVLFATPLTIAASGSAFAEQGDKGELGRLFTTPEQRALLDRQRELNMLESTRLNPEPTLQINGHLRRSSGKQTTWINGQSQHENESLTGLGIQTDARNGSRVRLKSGSAPPVSVKVGESIDPASQETTSPLGDGKIIVHKRPSSP